MKALELADELLADNEHLAVSYSEIAAELRRLAAVEAERDELKAELERIKALEPVAWRLLDKDPAGGSDDRWVVYTQDDFKPGVNPTEHFNIEPLYALGSKT